MTGTYDTTLMRYSTRAHNANAVTQLKASFKRTDHGSWPCPHLGVRTSATIAQPTRCNGISTAVPTFEASDSGPTRQPMQPATRPSRGHLRSRCRRHVNPAAPTRTRSWRGVLPPAAATVGQADMGCDTHVVATEAATRGADAQTAIKIAQKSASTTSRLATSTSRQKMGMGIWLLRVTR